MKPEFELELHVISPSSSPSDWIPIFSTLWPYTTAVHIRDKISNVKEIEQFINTLILHHIPVSKIGLNRQEDLVYEYEPAILQIGMKELYQIESLKSSMTRRGITKTRIGVSVHSLQEAKQAEHLGADFLLYGHIYPSSSKPGAAPRGVVSLQRVCMEVHIPVIAIGGIKPTDIDELVNAGASGIAVISGVMNAADPLGAVQEYHQALCRYGPIK
ncbi:thiamine phosphate synthase [Paenibacillus shunpengii]|uniref:Thiamine phosphate synthase n=1 Tax=Paenibacillus shunpengii TaxID=2054424 RepID=A0ABW5SP44_9BACL|nr:thiamine phosphate synthase [Paenibacillus sp. FSL H7-0326]OMC68416.1 hypothetical protein BK126_11300 [Paenibacillus sp. FSL H7-0326]